MDDGKTLVSIDFEGLARPASIFVEKVCNSLGILYEPIQIKRKAKANVEKIKIEEMGRLEISEIKQRALSRLDYEESKKQENIESIIAQATTQIREDAELENLEDDWISHFFERCRIVSDVDMQILWSKILAGEANKPGSYSKRTANIVSSLEKSDAYLFTKLCSFVIHAHGNIFPLILESNADIYKAHGVNFVSLIHLDYIGLIRLDETGTLSLEHRDGKFLVEYYGTRLNLTVQEQHEKCLTIGGVVLTESGTQLAAICGAKRNDEFLKYMIEHYKNGVWKFQF